MVRKKEGRRDAKSSADAVQVGAERCGKEGVASDGIEGIYNESVDEGGTEDTHEMV